MEKYTKKSIWKFPVLHWLCEFHKFYLYCWYCIIFGTLSNWVIWYIKLKVLINPLFIPGGRVGSFSANIQISQTVRLSHIKWKNIKRIFQISNWRLPQMGWMGSLSANNKFSFTIGLLYIKWKVMMCTFQIFNSCNPKISWMGLLSAKIKLSRTWRCRISNESSCTQYYIYHTSNLKNVGGWGH